MSEEMMEHLLGIAEVSVLASIVVGALKDK